MVREEQVLADGLEQGTLEWQEVAAPATMKEVLAAYDAQHDGDEEAEGPLDRELGRQGPIHVPGTGSHEREWFRECLGVLLRHHSSSRSVVDVFASDGREGSADLWAQC